MYLHKSHGYRRNVSYGIIIQLSTLQPTLLYFEKEELFTSFSKSPSNVINVIDKVLTINYDKLLPFFYFVIKRTLKWSHFKNILQHHQTAAWDCLIGLLGILPTFYGHLVQIWASLGKNDPFYFLMKYMKYQRWSFSIVIYERLT